ncbi:MAG: bL21 family ribosomal protein, partial [Bifidobacterium crudilactis]
MYAIVKAGGHQEKVEVGDVISVNRLDNKNGETVEFPVALVV